MFRCVDGASSPRARYANSCFSYIISWRDENDGDFESISDDRSASARNEILYYIMYGATGLNVIDHMPVVGLGVQLHILAGNEFLFLVRF